MILSSPGRFPLVWWLAGGLVLLGLVAWASLAFGALGGAGGGDYDQAVVWDLRWPRTLTGLAVGATLAAAGCLMQALTRNPLADPSVLGVNTGAAFAIVVALSLLGIRNPQMLFMAALVGGTVAASLVWVLGSGGASAGSPAQLALAGVVLTALLGSWTSALLLQNNESLDTVRSWLAGSLGGRTLADLAALSPWLVVGVVASLGLSRSLEVMGLGQDSARALGLKVSLVRNLTLLVVVWLTAVSVALAGPIGFIGLAVPHIARALAGPELTRSLPLGLVLGPLLLVGADVVGRVIIPPSEVPVGIVTAVLGAPLLISLAVRRGRR